MLDYLINMITKPIQQVKQDRKRRQNQIIESNSYNPLDYAYPVATSFIVNGTATMKNVVMSDS
tara:strand:- start:93 stop:281 length:189 start_codon:yes stop_codon:yes gene_type:complete